MMKLSSRISAKIDERANYRRQYMHVSWSRYTIAFKKSKNQQKIIADIVIVREGCRPSGGSHTTTAPTTAISLD